MNDAPASPSQHELATRLADAQARADALRERYEQEGRPSPGVLAARRLAVVGLPLLAAVATRMTAGGLLWPVLAAVAAFVAVIAVMLKFSPADPASTPGTRAFEALHTANLLTRVIIERRSAQATAQDPEQRARLARELVFLTEQFADNWAIIAARDASPGQGFIGFKPYPGP